MSGHKGTLLALLLTAMSDSELAVVSADSFATPTLITRAGLSTRKKFFEFFTVPIRNAHTRAAYYRAIQQFLACLLYTSDAADDLLCVDLGGRRIIKKK